MSGLGFGTRALVTQQQQSIIARPDVPRSKFIGSFFHKTTFDAGYLIPFLVEEVLPGDHLKYNVTAYVRMATPIFPLFSNQQVETFFFFVPNRLVWEHWKNMMGETQPTGDLPTDYTVPICRSTADGFAPKSLGDYFGLPTVNTGIVTGAIDANTLPFRAYTLIYNDWFRDQNIIALATFSTGDDDDDEADFSLKRRAKAHDYFTSCLPWPQKFQPPTINLGGLAPVKGLGFATSNLTASTGPINIIETDQDAGSYAYYRRTDTNPFFYIKADAATDASPEVFADLEGVASITVNELRQSFMIQSLLERDARGGTRYTEILKAHFGVTSPDARLQRPEYIGGGSSPLSITPIAQTAPSTSATVGYLGGAGTAVGHHNASYASTEHGFIIGIINVRTELSYQQGLHKMWTRLTRYDYYWPSLAMLGEQAVRRKEIFCVGDSTADETVFGYQERWHEYRTKTSMVTSLFRPQAAGTIDQWHLSQDFGGAPALTQSFIEDTPPMARVLAAGENAAGQQYLADIFIQREAVRPLPTFGTPATLGRF